MGLLKLADRYSVLRLEAACQRALSYTPNPSFKSVSTILSTGQDKVAEECLSIVRDESVSFGFTRGADYYGRKK
jgi:hypothetical protein